MPLQNKTKYMLDLLCAMDKTEVWYNVYMSKKVTINLDIERLPEGFFLATSVDVPGLVAQAKTFEEVVDIAEDIATTLLRTQKKVPTTPAQRIFYPLQLTV